MSRDLTDEPLFPSDDIQADILLGLLKNEERLLFFTIDDPAAFKTFAGGLGITSVTECLAQRDLIDKRAAEGITSPIPAPGLNVAFTFSGLEKLGVDGLTGAQGIEPFRDGMAQRTAKGKLTDPPAQDWRILGPQRPVDGVFVVTGSTDAEIANTIALQLAPVPGNGWEIVCEEHGRVRPDPVRGHEHFGFADGVSQPGVRGLVAPGRPLMGSDNPLDGDQGQPGQDLLWPGLFLFGYPEQNAHAAKFDVKGDVRTPPVPFMENGAYLVFRRLAQRVPEFDLHVKSRAAMTGDGSDAASAELLGAQMVGRWKSGAAIINAPTADDPRIADGTQLVNDFEFDGDREGLVCPWAAHVRKAYPRNDVRGNLTPTDDETDAAEAFTQAHRMMRRGIAYGPELTEAEALAGRSDPALSRGLLFKCYVTSLEDQFEFVQEQWVNAPSFSQPGAGVDPIIGQSATEPAPFLGAAPVSGDASKKPQLSFESFVEMQGGEFFFAPAISALRGL
jgi:Dyp-type peroxidase family